MHPSHSHKIPASAMFLNVQLIRDELDNLRIFYEECM